MCALDLRKDALDLINRLEVENERLNKVSEICGECHKNYAEKIEQAKSETIKEFAERLKNRVVDSTYPSFDKEGKPILAWKASGYKDIDNLVKEMTEVSENE